MKQSVRTALDIYKELSIVNAELNEIGEASSAIRMDFGEDHKGYILLKKQYDEKLQELRKLEKTKFVQEDQVVGREIPLLGFGEPPFPPSSDPEQYHHK